MSTNAQPGRPGNLTPEQEEKLAKMWTRLQEICAVTPESLGVTFDTKELVAALPAQDTQAESEADKGKKKGRFGFLSRGKKTEPAAANGAAPADDPGDKFGQNKLYQETIASIAPQEIRKTIWSMVKHDHPDHLVLRFLRARKWDVEKAIIMLIASMRWRHTEMQVDPEIMFKGEEGMVVASKSEDPDTKKLGEGFMYQLNIGKSLLHGIDRENRPICIVRVRLHHAADQTVESIERYTVYLIETARLLMAEPVDTANLIFDMTGFGLANMDYTPVKFMIKCFEANYPESLGVVLIHNAPWIFQGIWKVIKGWLDPVVASKVNFTNNLDDIQKYIPVERLPSELDGEENWQYQYQEPIAGENAKMKDTETRDQLLRERDVLYQDYERATVRWLREPGNKAHLQERDVIAKKLRVSYWNLDPYIRARSFYDRIGVINPGGVITHYPTQAAASAAGSQYDTSANGDSASGASGLSPLPLTDVTNVPAGNTTDEKTPVTGGNGAVPVNSVA